MATADHLAQHPRWSQKDDLSDDLISLGQLCWKELLLYESLLVLVLVGSELFHELECQIIITQMHH